LERSGSAIENDRVVIVRGKLQFKEDAMPMILVSRVTPIEVAEEFYARKAHTQAAGGV
jgi:hypothetical protein